MNYYECMKKSLEDLNPGWKVIIGEHFGTVLVVDGDPHYMLIPEGYEWVGPDVGVRILSNHKQNIPEEEKMSFKVMLETYFNWLQVQ